MTNNEIKVDILSKLENTSLNIIARYIIPNSNVELYTVTQTIV